MGGKSAEEGFFVTVVENVGPHRDVPMCSTADADIKQLTADLQALVILSSDALSGNDSNGGFFIQVAEGNDVDPAGMRSGAKWKYYHKIMEYGGAPEMTVDLEGNGLLVRRTYSATQSDLKNLRGENINFQTVLNILLKRYSCIDEYYFTDNQVASIVLMLRDGRKIDGLLDEIESRLNESETDVDV